jgi:hypothetical protein
MSDRSGEREGQMAESTKSAGPHLLGVRRFRLRHFISPDSYGMSLLVIALTYLLSVGVPREWSAIVVAVQMIAVWLIFRVSRASRNTRRSVRIFLVIVGVLLGVQLLLATVGNSSRATDAIPLLSTALYFLAPIAILRDIASRPTVDEESLYGALAAYLLIGMFYAFAYRSVAILQPGPFFGTKGEGTQAQQLFFSFVTLTTTGYGNLVPAKNPGQTLAVTEALMGQIFLLTAFAKVVSAWKPSAFAKVNSPAWASTDEEQSPESDGS